MTHRLMSVVAVLALASGCVVTSDGDGGSGGTGGSGAAGGSGGSGGTGGTGGTGANGGNGGTGGGEACVTPEECPTPAVECIEPTCDEGVCGTQNSAEGVLCETGVCDGAGTCVECIDGVVDCDGTAECVEGVCENTELGGECGDNFCTGAAISGPCLVCVQTNCQTENLACANDPNGANCTNCTEGLNGGDQNNFCTGSEAKAQALIDCTCGSDTVVGSCVGE